MAQRRMANVQIGQLVYVFPVHPDCDNCGGTGVFEEDMEGNALGLCAFCLEDAINEDELEIRRTDGKAVTRSIQ